MLKYIFYSHVCGRCPCASVQKSCSYQFQSRHWLIDFQFVSCFQLFMYELPRITWKYQIAMDKRHLASTTKQIYHSIENGKLNQSFPIDQFISIGKWFRFLAKLKIGTTLAMICIKYTVFLLESEHQKIFIWNHNPLPF